MTTVQSTQLQNLINSYLDGKINAAELERFFKPRVPFFLQDNDSANIVAAVQTGLKQLFTGERTEDSLRALLAEVPVNPDARLVE